MEQSKTQRLKGKVAIVIGGGQSIGETIGNGRATSITYAREGAKVLVVDSNLESAQETTREIERIGGVGLAYRADVTIETEIKMMVEYAKKSFELGLIRNHYVGRTFIEPTQSIRSFGVKLKLNAAQTIIKNKSGLLFNSGDSRDLASAMNKVMELDKDALSNMGIEGRNNVIKMLYRSWGGINKNNSSIIFS